MDHYHHSFHLIYEKSIQKFTIKQTIMCTIITCRKGNWCYDTNDIF